MNNMYNYPNMANKIRREIPSEIENTLEFAIFRANVQYLLPEYTTDVVTMYKEAILYKELAVYDLTQEAIHEQVRLKGNYSILNKNHPPKIFCTFHFGSERLINAALASNNLSYSLVLNDYYYKKEGETYFSMHDEYKNKHGDSYTFNIINAEENNIGYKLVKAIKNKHNLLFYIDGNTGVGGIERQDKKLIPINFLEKKIYVRKGIAHLSHLLNVPIVPIISYRESLSEQNIILDFLPEIVPDKNVPIDKYEKKATQKIYNLFEIYLQKYPEQWGSWFHFHSFLGEESLKDTFQGNSKISEKKLSLKFNLNRFNLIVQDSKYGVFDILTYTYHPSSKRIHEYLHYFCTYKIPLPSFDKRIINKLLAKEILIY